MDAFTHLPENTSQEAFRSHSSRVETVGSDSFVTYVKGGLAPALFFWCRMTTPRKNDLNDRLFRYRQITLSMIW